ncbi:MAG: peroxiredoxin [Candidatus Eisenbacteria bacterium]|nr:peroxiredoxin [Candidatus Eisenbacteria bacterium]
MPRAGDAAPSFSGKATSGQIVSLADFRGKKLILYFYPKDNTPGCTTEACDFRDNLGRLSRKGAAVLGVSPDSVVSHARFAAKHDLSFPLLCDPDRAVAQAYGVWVEKTLAGHVEELLKAL